MLICRRRSAHFLSSLNRDNINYNNNTCNFLSNSNDSVNLVTLGNGKALSACIKFKQKYRINEMDSKKVFSKTGTSCPCYAPGSSVASCAVHNHKRRAPNERRDIDNYKESINKDNSKQQFIKEDRNNVWVHATGSNIVASTSYGTTFLETVSTNFHCPSVHQQLLFQSYLRQNTNFPSNQCPSVAFQRSFSASSILDRQNNFRYHRSGELRGKSGSSRVLSSPRSTPIAAMRRWDVTQYGKIYYRTNKTSNTNTDFMLISYNVLAQDLLVEHPELYVENDKNALLWDFRWRNLYQEIKEQNGDILCLQEVQKSHIDKYFSLLYNLGYNMIYKQRTGIRTDGCAIYYKTDKFVLIESTTVEYRQPNVSLLDRDNIAIVATFAPKNNLSAQFVVATTHLLYNPKRQDVRLAQTQVLLAEIERFAYRRNEEGNEYYVPVIITGDFNSLPSSAIYKFIINGKFKYESVMLRSRYQTGKVLIPQFLYITDNCQHAELVEKRMMNTKLSREDEEQMIRIQNSEQKVEKEKRHNNYQKHIFSSGMLTHNFDFGSVYRHNVSNDTEGTTYQDEWVTVDYIFYSGGRKSNNMFQETNLKLLSKYTLPTRSELEDVRIPNFELGSDHLSLIAKFKLEYNN